MAIHYNTISTRLGKSNNNKSHNRNDECDRHSFNFQSIKYLLILLLGANNFLYTSKAETVGGGGIDTENTTSGVAVLGQNTDVRSLGGHGLSGILS